MAMGATANPGNPAVAVLSLLCCRRCGCRCVAQNLHRAFVYKDRSDKGWDGLKSPVRPVMEGPHALRLEVAYFVARTYVLPFFKQVAAIVCGLGALAILQSQMAIFPGLPKRYGLVIVIGSVKQRE